jgi:hypothetical protein
MLALAAAFALGGASVAAQEQRAKVVPGFRDGALFVDGSGFGDKEMITITVTADGETKTFTAPVGPGGAFFNLITNLPVTAGQEITIAARGDHGTVAAAVTATVPADIGPFRPVVNQAAGVPATGVGGLAQSAGAAGTSAPSAPMLVAVILGGIGLVAVGASWLRRRRAA